jgi:hypothetical protein
VLLEAGAGEARRPRRPLVSPRRCHVLPRLASRNKIHVRLSFVHSSTGDAAIQEELRRLATGNKPATGARSAEPGRFVYLWGSGSGEGTQQRCQVGCDRPWRFLEPEQHVHAIRHTPYAIWPLVFNKLQPPPSNPGVLLLGSRSRVWGSAAWWVVYWWGPGGKPPGRMGPHDPHGVGMGLAWGWHGVGMGYMGWAWGWHGVGMGLAWGWHAVGMGFAWGLHGVGMGFAWGLHGVGMGSTN